MTRSLKESAGEAGFALLETLLALALLGTVGAAYLSGLATTSRAVIVADEQSTGGSLAETEMEWVKKADYVPGATTYSAAPIPGGSDYTGYSVNITAVSLRIPDDGIQQITVTVKRGAKQVLTLDGYKVDR